MKALLLFLTCMSITLYSWAQENTGIGTTNPHPSAQLEVFSSTQGLLIPRMTCNQRDSISSPADGLLVYVTDTCSNGSLPGFFFFSGGPLIWKPLTINFNLIAGNTLDEAYDEGTSPGDGRIINADAGAVVINANGSNESLQITNSGFSRGILVNTTNGEGIGVVSTNGVGVGITSATQHGVEVTNNTPNGASLIKSTFGSSSSSDRFSADGHAAYFEITNVGNSKSPMQAITFGTGSGVVGATNTIPANFNSNESPVSSGVLGIAFQNDDRNGTSGISNVGHGQYGKSSKVNSWSAAANPKAYRAGSFGIGDYAGSASGSSSNLFIGQIGYAKSGIGVLGTNDSGGHGVVGTTKGAAGGASQAGVWAITQDVASWSSFTTQFPLLDNTTPKGSIGMLAQSRESIAVWAESQTEHGLIATTGAKKALGDLTNGTSALYAISTQTDASSAIIRQEGASSKPAMSILSNSMEAGLFLNETGNGIGVHIRNELAMGSSSSSQALLIENFKEGNTVEIKTENPANGDTSILSTTKGVGKVAVFNIQDNDANASPVFTSETKGVGSAAIFEIDDNDSGALANSSPVVEISSDAKGVGLSIKLTNATTSGVDENPEPALEANHAGMGNGALIKTTNVANTKSGLDVDHAGRGYGLEVTGENMDLDAVVFATRTSPSVSTPDKGMVAHFDYAVGAAATSRHGVLISSSALTSSVGHAALRVTSGRAGIPGVVAAAFEGDVDISSGLEIGGDIKMSGDIGAPILPVGSIFATSITAPTKAFTIDHPLDPKNKSLIHISIESDEYLNLYTGKIKTDGAGFAHVEMPKYTTALNTDFRYNLTVIGKEFAQAIIWQEINSDGEFIIKTNLPNIEVSWQLSGVRKDQWAIENPLQVEQAKKSGLKGRSHWGLNLEDKVEN